MRYSITEEQLVHQLLNREAAEGGSQAGKADQELSRLSSRLRLLSCLVRARPSNPSLLSQPAPTPALLQNPQKTVERPENTNEQRRSERRSDQRVTWHRESSTTAVVAMVEMVEMVVDMASTFRVRVLGAGVGGITRVNEGS